MFFHKIRLPWKCLNKDHPNFSRWSLLSLRYAFLTWKILLPFLIQTFSEYCEREGGKKYRELKCKDIKNIFIDYHLYAINVRTNNSNESNFKKQVDVIFIIEKTILQCELFVIFHKAQGKDESSLLIETEEESDNVIACRPLFMHASFGDLYFS